MESHQIRIELREDVPEEIEVDTHLAITVRVSCSSGCDLRPGRVSLMTADHTLATAELISFEAGTCEADELVFRTPNRLGEHDLSILYTDQSSRRALHEERPLPIVLRTRAHGTSLATWGIPQRVTIGERFRVKVGAKCSVGCEIHGSEVAIHDETGERIASARLGETPWPGTSALYWVELELAVPEREGISSWSARFAPTELEVPHDDASANLSVVATRPPEHQLTIRVADRSTGESLEDARVLAVPYRGVTDANGQARLGLPAGTFQLVVRKVGYIEQTCSVDVAGNMTVDIEIEPEPEKNELDDWM